MASKAFNLSKGVFSFNGRKGIVTPQTGDYTAEMVGAIKDYSSLKLYGDNVNTIINTPGWYRVCIDKTKRSGGTSAIFFLGHTYSSGGPSDMLVYVNFRPYNPEIVILSNPTPTNGAFPVDNLRLTYDESEKMYFLDAHYTLSVGNQLGIDCIASSRMTNYPVLYEFPDPVLVSDAPEGEQILTYAGWVSPPMKLGVEYRSTERYNGKPVYAKLVNFGKLPNATSAGISHGSENVLTAISGSLIGQDGTLLNIYDGITQFTIGSTIIVVRTNKDMSSVICNVLMKYIKSTD